MVAPIMMNESPYFTLLRRKITALGGLFNAHLHLDRAGTFQDNQEILKGKPTNDSSYLSLSAKHSLIPSIHASASYHPENLHARTNTFLDLMVGVGTTWVETFVDVTADSVGLSALQEFLRIKQDRKQEVNFRVGAYSPLGFKESEPERWSILAEGAALADFIGSLPERDDHVDYPDHIGFQRHCEKILALGQELHKPIHIHVDQRNDPRENGTERILDVVNTCGLVPSSSDEPTLWLIHVISPSTYEEARFQGLMESLVHHNIGVICCPSAALSMRQLRPTPTPTYNSIARVLEMLAMGVFVRIGSDNIFDITSPAGTPDLVDEIFVLSNALRFYDLDIWAKVGAGCRLDPKDREKIINHLKNDSEEIDRAIKHYGKSSPSAP